MSYLEPQRHSDVSLQPNSCIFLQLDPNLIVYYIYSRFECVSFIFMPMGVQLSWNHLSKLVSPLNSLLF